MVSQKIINIGLLAIAGGSALAIYALRDRIFPGNGDGQKQASFDLIDANCIAFDVDEVNHKAFFDCSPQFTITNQGDVPIQGSISVKIIISAPGQNEEFNDAGAIFPEIQPGQTVNFIGSVKELEVNTPANITFVYALTDETGFVYSTITIQKVMREDGLIVDR